MSELAAHSALLLDAVRPANHHRVADAAEMRSNLLSPFKRCVACPRPRCGVMRIHFGTAPFIEPAVRLDRFQLLVNGKRDAV